MGKVITQDDLDLMFTHVPPRGEVVSTRLAMRGLARDLAQYIYDVCPAGRDRAAAIRHVRLAMLTAFESFKSAGDGFEQEDECGAK